ncbi:unnamed protein product [Cylindrotheca closterium]|uniref:Uncharacterized protein n=1 Tax=Cylindrotheca closterium TaxID=2856 RepID=A0AAD2G681_9STRA|nr:unnamed protein product [Cylindrotheca closterium]
MSDAFHIITGTPAGTQEATVPADNVAVGKHRNGGTCAENGAEEHNSAPTYRDTVTSPPAPTVPLTTDERLMCLLAVHWNASPFRHTTLFNVSIVFDWQGVGLTEFNQVQTAYNAFHQFASGIWGEITSKVVLLPFADTQLPRQQLWIRNLNEFDEKAKDWAHLKNYLDPNFGNPYILNKPGKTGLKTYKTQMRFGMSTAPPILMQELHSVLSSEPLAGVFPTSIQVSDMVRFGFLPLLPQELAIGPYCKDLMRLCNFQYPIGLMQEWADLILAANLDIRRLSCALFQAPTHYTRDWQAAKDELVHGKQCPQLQLVIEAMQKLAMRLLTAVYRIPIELPGMLTSAATENLAFVVTDAHVKKAEDPVEDKKKSLLTAPKSTEEDDAWIKQLAQMDLTNDRPSPLFVMILPAEEDGRYLPLAMNVLDNLPSFLQFHLGELSFPNFIQVIKNWSATDLAYQNRRLHVKWVPSELCSCCIDNPTGDQGHQVRDPMDYLLCLEDPVEILEGTLHIDIHPKHVQDVDNAFL